MKRRCAGCSAVIEGWSQRHYCSEACSKRHRRQLARTASVRARSPVETVIRGTNGTLIAEVARLGYLGDTVLDTTYGEGSWWTRHRPSHLVGCDADPTKARDIVADFTRLPFADGSFKHICYDPPYISTGNRETSSVDDLYDRFGLGKLKGWRRVRALMDAGMADVTRVLARRGLLLVKCMDYTESGRKVWNTFHIAAEGERLGLRLVDRFHHLTGGGPQPMDNLDGSPREQKGAREVTSMLLVFTK